MTLAHALRRIVRPLLAAALGVGLALAPVGRAEACSIEGGFVQPQTDQLFGASFDGASIRVVLPDSNGNLVTVTIPPPPGMPAAAYGNVRLSPSRDFLFTWAGDGLNTDIYIYNVPPMGAGFFTPVIEGVEIPGMIAHRGWYDRPEISPRRTCYVASTRTLASTEQQKILWVDLEAGVFSFDPFDFNSPIGAVTFAPSGTCVLVQHDTNDISVTDYNVISLCDGDFGANIAPGALLNLDEAASGRVVRVRDMGGNPVFDVEVFHQPSQGPEVIDRVFTLDDCACTATPLTGACCFSDGSCMAGLTQAECTMMGGSAWTAAVDCAVANCDPSDPTGSCCFSDGSCMVLTNSDCAAMGGTSWVMNGTCSPNFCPPPQPVMSVALAGPTTVYAGQLYTYAVTYANSGSATGMNVQVRMTIPSGSVFQGADQGGTRSGSQVIWNLPNLPVGAQNTVHMDVLAFCSSTTITASIYSVFTNPGGTVNGTSPVVSTVVPENQDPVDVLVEAISLPNDPVRAGDRIGYRITIDNTSPEYRSTLRTNIYPRGGMIEAVTDDGGGTVQVFGNQIQWSGDFEPFESRSFELDFLVDDCLEFFDSEAGIEQFDVMIGCGPTVGFSEGLRFPTFQETSANFTILPAPGDTGPGSMLPEIYGNQVFAPIRRGAIFQMQFILDNNTSEVKTLSFEGDIPAGMLAVGDPPFVPPTDAGAWYDAESGTYGWDGDLPAFGQVQITALVQMDPMSSECQASPRVTGGEGDCQSISAGMTLLIVPEVPDEPYLVGMSSARGLWLMEKGQNVQQSLFCLPAEINTNLSLAPNGDIYVSGLAAYRFNPITLDFEVYDFGEFSGEGGGKRGEGGEGGGSGDDVPGTFDIAVYSAADDTVYWLGSNGNGAAIWQMPAGTAEPTLLFESSDYFGFTGGRIDPEGRILIPSGAEIVRIDPAQLRGGMPGIEVLTVDAMIDDGGLIPSTDSSDTSISRIEIDADGNYLLLLSRGWSNMITPSNVRFTNLWALARYDRTTDTTEMIADRVAYYSIQFPGSTNPLPPAGLNPMFVLTSINLSMTPTDNGDILIGGNGPQSLRRVGRACGIQGTTIFGEGMMDWEFGPVDLKHTRPTRPFEGDVNMDGFVDFVDLNMVLNNWASPVPMGTSGDINMDGAVNQADLESVLGTWNFTCP